jgi:hypothetical protein
MEACYLFMLRCEPIHAAHDSGSVYEPHPMLTYKWDSDKPVMHRAHSTQNGSTFGLGPHPSDPNSLPSPTHDNGFPGPNVQQHQVPGHEIWVYDGNGAYV